MCALSGRHKLLPRGCIGGNWRKSASEALIERARVCLVFVGDTLHVAGMVVGRNPALVSFPGRVLCQRYD